MKLPGESNLEVENSPISSNFNGLPGTLWDNERFLVPHGVPLPTPAGLPCCRVTRERKTTSKLQLKRVAAMSNKASSDDLRS